MTTENMNDLRANTRIGFCDKFGRAWTFDANDPNSVANHFPGAVPLASVEELFGFDAVSRPLFVDLDIMGMQRIEGKQAIVRNDNGHVMGVFSDGYEIHQYRESLLNRVSLLLDSTLAIGSAGLLKHGAQAWVAIELENNFTTPEGEIFRPRLTACTSHDGSIATTYKRMIMRPVCDNTLRAGLSEDGEQIKIKHSKYSKMRLQEARDALNLIHAIADDYAAECKALCEVKVSDKEWSLFLEAHVPMTTDKGEQKAGRSLTIATNEREQLTQLWNNDNRVSPWHGTGWGVLQAVNTFGHHYATVKGMSREERNMSSAIAGKFDDLDAATVATLDRVLTAAR